MHYAAEFGYSELAKALITRRADPNLIDRFGNTPLYIAVLKGHVEVMKALPQAKIDPNMRGRFGFAALHLTVARCNTRGITKEDNYIDRVKAVLMGEVDLNKDEQYMFRNSCFPTKMCNAKDVAKGDGVDMVKALLEAGADPNLHDRHGISPLHCAIHKGYAEVVEALINKGADIDLQDKVGNTPLHFAARNGHEDIAKFLIACGVKLQGSNAQKPRYLVQLASGFIMEMSEYCDKCLEEIKKMEQRKTDRGITLYDILVSKGDKLLFHIQKVRSGLGEIDYGKKFPIYGNDLKCQFKIGNRRLDALEAGSVAIGRFSCPSGSPALGYDVGVKIAGYLNNEEIEESLKEIGMEAGNRGACTKQQGNQSSNTQFDQQHKPNDQPGRSSELGGVQLTSYSQSLSSLHSNGK